MSYSNQRGYMRSIGRLVMMASFGVAAMLGSPATGNSQALGWEGETGVFVTPMAYTASAAGQKIHPMRHPLKRESASVSNSATPANSTTLAEILR